jgi:hypothetical protein
VEPGTAGQAGHGHAHIGRVIQQHRGDVGVGSFTLNGSGTNADGSTFKFHQNGHTVFDSAGVPKRDFSKTNGR